MAFVIDPLAETTISILLEAVVSLLKEKVGFVLNAKDNLKMLQRKLECLRDALKAEDRRPFLSSQRDREREGLLKRVLYDAEDIIEDYRTKIELNKRRKGLSLRNKVRKPWIPLRSSFKVHIYYPYQLSKRIKNINQMLIDQVQIDSEIENLLKRSTNKSGEDTGISGESGNPRETTYHIGAQSPTGRENAVEEVKKRLFDGSSSVAGKRGVSIVSIVGKGGIGKTTLAKMVFHEVEVEEQFGKCKWWVFVPKRPSREDLLRKILTEIRGGTSKGITPMSLNTLCREIKNELSKNKFFLVLDDVWELDWWWGDVEGTLMVGAIGSKILITSRTEEASQGIGAKMYKLPEMSFAQSWHLFLEKALKEENELVSHNLKEIAVRIVSKCGGLPLVVGTVGSIMRTTEMTKDGWESVEKREIWEWTLPSSEYSEILPGLILSYDYLPLYLKSCFVYCCIFPKNYEIEREELIMQWVAHGLIEKKKDIDVEVTAKQYIDDLIKRCLIEETKKGFIKMHDILHDLASYIGGKEYCHASPTELTRHLFILDPHDPQLPMPNASEAQRKLRTLLSGSHLYSSLVSIARITNLKWLRVLSMAGDYRIDELLNSFESLRLLKYLDLSKTNITHLHSSIGGLWNLQTLNLNHSRIRELPKEIGELCNLSYLGLEGTEELNFVAEGLGRLTNLRTLHRFLVCDGRGNENGCNIGELKEMKKLNGNLSIGGLGRGMVKVIDAKEAHLKEKQQLIGVELDFGIRDDSVESDFEMEDNDKPEAEMEDDDDDKVDHVDNLELELEKRDDDNASNQSGLLEALQPPQTIESLAIYHYKGGMPAWYSEKNLAMLRTLMLKNCPLWAEVLKIDLVEMLLVHDCPALCEIPSLPFLKSLEIKNCDGLNTIGGMPALGNLMFETCGSLEQVANMPALKSLKVKECDRLEQVFGMPALNQLIVESSNQLKVLNNMPALQLLKVDGCERLEQVADMPNLKSLTVEQSSRLKRITNMHALEELELLGCESLEQVADMPTLKILKLMNLNSLKVLPCFPSLEAVRVERLQNWEGWAPGTGEAITSMPHLQEVGILNCPKLQTQGLLHALSKCQIQLQELMVCECSGARFGRKFLNHLPNLISLHLSGVVLLEDDDDDGGEEESAPPSPLWSKVTTSVTSLRSLILANKYGDMRWRRVPQWVWDLSHLESLWLEGFTEEIGLGGHWQSLPKLQNLNVYEFPNLKSLVDITPQQNAAATTCTTNTKEQIACLSKLESFIILRCPTLVVPRELRDALGDRLMVLSDYPCA